MAKTKLSDLGSSVCVDDQNEKTVPALGDGNGIPGDLCGIDSNGKITGTYTGTKDEFVGILKESKITGTETAPGDGIPCTLVVPKSGHNYRIRTLADIDGSQGSLGVGGALDFSGTAFKADKAADIIHAIMRLSLAYVDNDEVAEVTWA